MSRADIPKPDWIAVDCGADALHVWAMQGTAAVAQAHSDTVCRASPNGRFIAELSALIGAWEVDSHTPIIACGLTAPACRPVPCTPLDKRLHRVPDAPLNIQVIAGLKQPSPADVMCGEETRIAGFLALNPGWDGVICLPGPHSKWAQVSAGEVVSFQTYISGELFALLAGHSVLQPSVQTDGFDTNAFADAISDILSRPERLAAQLFAIHAANLLNGAAPQTARARLSGLLIGAELAAARAYWLGQNIALIGDAAQAALYARALETQGVPATLADAPRMTLAGLTAAYRLLKAAP